MIGYVHSFESMGLHDGPGIRSVVFMKGCPLRCIYCHNPDTWDYKNGEEISIEYLINKISRYKSFFNSSGGGVTISGGEPLMQSGFVKELLMECKEKSIHTALDTSGVGIKKEDIELLDYVDLLILDIKHWDSEKYKEITGIEIDNFLEFVDIINNRFKGELWIRHVVVPGISDNKKSIDELKMFLNKLAIKKIDKLELLPFHNMAQEKYEKLNIEYPLKDVESIGYEYVKGLLG